MYKNKLRIAYKSERDSFEAHALCDDGYCYQVYMRNMKNDPAPPKYLKRGLSHLHLWTMVPFDSLKDNHHHVGMDNLYNSTNFLVELHTIMTGKFYATVSLASLAIESLVLFFKRRVKI